MPNPQSYVAPGGFAWWYVDLLDAQGNGVVLIWSFGLPFLPGRAREAREGRGAPARDRPSVNVALYRGGRLFAYLLQETTAASEGDDAWRFGDSTVRREVGDRVTVEANLRCALPGRGELAGRIVVRGPTRTGGDGGAGSHEWCLVAGPAFGEAHLTVDGEALTLSGPAYHDRNAAPAALHDLGFRRWAWGRATDGEDLIVWYVVWPRVGDPETTVLRIDRTGHTERIPAQARLGGLRHGWLGMPRWAEVVLIRDGVPWLTAALDRAVDEGPFYIRQLGRAAVEGRTMPVVAEVCDPDRMDRAPTDRLVAMAVHRTAGPNSLWLPLFSGPRRGRMGRLLRWAAS